jgi:hypothetical protein
MKPHGNRIIGAVAAAMICMQTACSFNIGPTRSTVSAGTRLPASMTETPDGKKMVVQQLNPKKGTVLFIVKGQLDSKPKERETVVDSFEIR